MKWEKREAKMIKSSKKVIQTDISPSTEQENIESRLKAMEYKLAHLEGIQSAMPDPYYIRDMDYNIVLWPPSIAKLTGFSEEEAKKLKCYDMFRACVCPPVAECPTQRCIQVREFLRDVAVDVYHKNGDTIHCLVSNAGVYDENGNPIGAVEIVKDNTVIKNTMDSIGIIIKNIESASNNLHIAMEKVNSISEKVKLSTSDSFVDIKIGVQTVSERAGESSKYINSVQTNMENINESMKFSVGKILSLKQKSEMIIEFIKMMQEISSKTNLLAINASIEAAHAGESGRGFKVVADGIRELSKNSNESAQSINNTVKDINELIKETTTSFNVTEKDVESGTNTISDLLIFLNSIADSINEVMKTIGVIETATAVTTGLIGEQNESVADVSSISNELSDIARKLTLEFEKVFNAIQHTDMG
jgi:PAS domain S-box-containing protein